MTFSGWPAVALEFYEGLEADNSKTYWTAHKAVYEAGVLAPMDELLAELEDEFGEAKVFRPNRDIRFSADKSPYKTAIGATLSAGGYVQLSADGLAAGAEPVGRELDVAALRECPCDGGLVRRLVLAEADVAVGAEDPPLPELAPELGQQLLHRAAHDLLVDRLVLDPIRLGVVGLEPLVELDRFGRPSTKRHGRGGYSATTRATAPGSPGPGTSRETAGCSPGPAAGPGVDLMHSARVMIGG